MKIHKLAWIFKEVAFLDFNEIRFSEDSSVKKQQNVRLPATKRVRQIERAAKQLRRELAPLGKQSGRIEF